LQVIRCLGSGPKASVFLAREPELKRLVAIKVLAPKLIEDPRARARFEREAQAAASLSHPNIVAVHTVGRLSNDAPYISMQYVKGRTLAERLEAEEAIPVEEARRALADIAAALAAAHNKGIVHRDVRPANVLHDEETGRYLLADFGIAGVLSSGEQEPGDRLTKTGETVGDPMWMSPELLMGQPLTERSDIYGLGLLGYATLAKSSPYDASSRQDLIRAHVRDRPRRLCKLRDGVDRQLDDLLFRCLAKEPGHRPNAADVAARLSEPLSTTSGSFEVLQSSFLSKLIARRMPQIVILYALVAWAILQVVDQLADRDVLPELAYRFTLASAVAGLPAVLVGAWYHGKKGGQPFRKIEYWLFGVLALIWLTVCAIIYVWSLP
jgi:serine/threonine protein kinase